MLLVSHQRIIIGTGGLGNKRTSGDHPNHYTFEIGQNTEKSPGDLSERPSANANVKSSLGVKYSNNNISSRSDFNMIDKIKRNFFQAAVC